MRLRKYLLMLIWKKESLVAKKGKYGIVLGMFILSLSEGLHSALVD